MLTAAAAAAAAKDTGEGGSGGVAAGGPRRAGAGTGVRGQGRCRAGKGGRKARCMLGNAVGDKVVALARRLAAMDFVDAVDMFGGDDGDTC